MNLGLRKALFKTPDRRQAGDEIADVIELLHQDAAHLLARHQRPAGDDHPRRLGIGRKAVFLARQARMMEGVAEPERVAPDVIEPGLVENVVHFGAARHLVVGEGRVRRVDDAQTRAPHSQAHVDVVVDDRMLLIEAADLIESGAAHQHAGARQRRDVALGDREAEGAEFVALGEAEGVAAAAFDEKEPGVLHAPVGIEQARADDPDFRLLGVLHHRV